MSLDVKESARSATRSLAAHKLRSALTMLGMVFGVGAVIAMLSIGAGAERQALETIGRLGLRNVLVRAKEIHPDQREEAQEKSPGVAQRDAQAIADTVPGVELTAPRVRVDTYRVRSASARSGATVWGVSAAYPELTPLALVEGRFIDPLDERTHAQVCVVGLAVRRDLFGAEPALGALLKINDVWFEVIGVLAEENGGVASVDGVQVGSAGGEIYVPVSTALRKFDREPTRSPYDEIIVRLAADTPPSEAAAQVSALLARLHGGADDWEVVVPSALLAASRRTQRLFSVVMGCIAGISLLVGGIGIMNIMLATVLERTREIGVRRAVGARRAEIRLQFLVEAFVISALGGVTGIVLGVGIAKVVAASAGWPTVVTLPAVLLATGVSVSVGLASGYYPAVRAAELDPIEALRYE